jgi:hypothetical protein
VDLDSLGRLVGFLDELAGRHNTFLSAGWGGYGDALQTLHDIPH